MIDSIGTTAMHMPPQRMQNAAALTEEQAQLVSDTLGRFDSTSLTEADAQSIVSIFEEAGIQPGRALAEAMDIAGFDARTVGDMAGRQGPAPGGSQGHNEGLKLSEDVMKELYTLLDQYYAEGTSETDRNSLVEAIQGLLGSETSILSARA